MGNANGVRAASGLGLAVISALVLAAWALFVLAWPGVAVSDPAQSQTAGLIATIDITLIVIVPAVALVLLQVLSPFSSRALRAVLAGPTVPVLLVALILGVIAPVWFDASPSMARVRFAFVGLGATIVAVIFSVLWALRRVTPQSLADFWTRRAHGHVSRTRRGKRRPSRRMPELSGILAELAGSNLPDRTRQQVFSAWTSVVVARAEAEPSEEIVRAVEDLVAGPSRAAAGAQRHLVDALAAVGAARFRDGQIHTAVARALRELAIHARANGDRLLGHDALDALVSIDIARLAGLLPDQRHPSLTRVRTRNPESVEGSVAYPAPPRKSRFRHCDPPVYQDAELVAARVDSRHEAGAAYDLICDSIAHLSAMLAGSRPGSSWPGGWQGVGALERDVERIGRLALSLYENHRYPSGVVEEALENAAIQLLSENRPAHKLPTDRTGWRLAHTPAPAGPAITVAKTLAELMVAAFAAGFDRRALLTGRRLLAAATVAIQEGDTGAAEGYAHALDKALNEITSNVDNSLIAYQRRDSVLIAGLIAEFPPLLEAMGTEADRIFANPVSEVIHHLPWRTYSNPWLLAGIAWRARLAAVGWPVSVPGVSRVDWFAPPPAPNLWRTSLSDLAESELRMHLGAKDPIYPAALLISLWANAVVAAQNGELTPRTHLRELLRDAIEDYDKAYAQRPAQRLAGNGDDEVPGVRSLDPQLRRLIDAAIQWTMRRDPAAPARIPPSRDRQDLRRRIEQLLETPKASNWHYHGLVTDEDTKLVIVEEGDGSRRLLRDGEAGAHGLFAWGYGGSGPHTFADVLATDILADLVRCPHCLGAAPCGAALVTCGSCRGTGRIRGRTKIAELLVERVISKLPHQVGKPSPLRDAVWMVSRHELLAATCAPVRRRSARGG